MTSDSMTTAADLLALADRVEREEPSRKLDAEIELLFVQHDGSAFADDTGWVVGGREQPVKARPFTSSLDAAASLMPETWHLYMLHIVDGEIEARAKRKADTSPYTRNIVFGNAPDEPRARTAAALRARAMEATMTDPVTVTGLAGHKVPPHP